MNKKLPETANLEQLRKQAKDLHRSLKSKQSQAFKRVLESHPEFQNKRLLDAEQFEWKISDAQYILAKEYGYKSWAKLKAEIELRVDERFNIRRIIPLIPVSNIQSSLKFYEDILGFHRVSHATNGDKLYWCRLKRDGIQIMIEEGRKDFVVSEDPIKLCFITKDVDRVYSQLIANGLSIDEPCNASYGMRQIFIKDPDRHIIWFESPLTKKDLKAYTE